MRRATSIAAGFVALLSLCVAPAIAQQSPGYVLEEHVLNSGGNPGNGIDPASTNYRLSLSSIGEGPSGAMPSGPSYSIEGGFVGAYIPPSEVFGLRFVDAITLAWNNGPSAGSYAVYRGSIDLVSSGAGDCLQDGIPATNWSDASIPASGSTSFYLIGIKNRLGERGGLGQRSDGFARVAATECP